MEEYKLPSAYQALAEQTVMELLGLSRNTVRHLRKSRKLPYFSVGRASRYPAAGVAVFMAEQASLDESELACPPTGPPSMTTSWAGLQASSIEPWMGVLEPLDRAPGRAWLIRWWKYSPQTWQRMWSSSVSTRRAPERNSSSAWLRPVPR